MNLLFLFPPVASCKMPNFIKSSIKAFAVGAETFNSVSTSDTEIYGFLYN